MNRSDLVDHVAGAVATKAAAKAVVDLIFAKIADEVAAGNTVAIKGFGTFEPRHRAAREGRNMHTGAPVAIPARSVMGFKPSKSTAQAE